MISCVSTDRIISTWRDWYRQTRNSPFRPNYDILIVLITCLINSASECCVPLDSNNRYLRLVLLRAPRGSLILLQKSTIYILRGAGRPHSVAATPIPAASSQDNIPTSDSIMWE